MPVQKSLETYSMYRVYVWNCQYICRYYVYMYKCTYLASKKYYIPSYGLNSTPAVLQQRWLKYLITYED